MKKVLRAAVLTLVTAGIFAAAAYPKTPVKSKTNAAPIPTCNPWLTYCD